MVIATKQSLITRIESWVSGVWYGDSFSFGHVFLWLAVWNAFVGAVSVIVWPRVYGPEVLAYMPPRSIYVPVASCFFLASLFKDCGIRPTLKAVMATGLAVAVVSFFWSEYQIAWLNQHGYLL